ncbi:MAG: hypothetical protein M3397_09535 [Actinomycetota bacterium]|nr:hypothetical protein [Actinomycetota bacterium]
MKKFAIPLIAVLILAGCGVQIPGSQGDQPPPRITADRAAVQQYWDQVRPILDDTARDVAGVADVDVNFDGGNVSVGIDPNAIQQAQRETRQGLDELKAIQPPDGLEETHRRLITAYEEALPALDNFIGAVQSGDAIRIADSVRNDLPKIQRLISEIDAVRQQLRQASK